MKRGGFGCVWGMLLCLFAFSVQAEAPDENRDKDLQHLLDVRLDELPSEVDASTTSHMSQSIRRSPSAVHVITHDEIDAFGYRTLAEVLGAFPGVFTLNDHQNTYLGLRGFNHPGDYNTRILLLIDGVRANDNVYDSVFVGRAFPLDVGMIERVEYVPGAGAAIYGDNAFFGVINVITRGASSLRGGEGMLRTGSLHSRDTRVSFGNRLDNGLEYVLSADRSDRGSQNHPWYENFSVPLLDGGMLPKLDRERSDGLFARVSWRDWSFSANFDRWRNEQPPFFFVPGESKLRVPQDNVAVTADDRVYIRLNYSAAWAADWRVNAGLEFHRSDSSVVSPAYLSPTEYYNLTEAARGRWWNADVVLVYSGLPEHRVLMVADMQTNVHQEYRDYVPSFPDMINVASHSRHFGIALQDDWKLNANWSAVLGASLDHTPTGQEWHPRLGLIWLPNKTTTLKLLYGSAFRDPNFFERLTNQIAGAPEESSETIHTFETVLEKQLGRRTRLTASVYGSRLDHLSTVTFTPDGYTAYVNAGALYAKGLEVDFTHHFENNAQARISYALQRTTYQGVDITNSPRHLLSARAWMPLGAWRMAGELRYRSSLNSFVTVAPAAWLASVNVQRDIGRHFRVGLGVSNLFNRVTYDPTRFDYLGTDLVRQDGREIRLTLQFHE